MVSALPTAQFALINHHGEPVTQADFQGRFQLVYFGFTHCRVICQRSLKKLHEVLDQLGPMGEDIAALYVTVDPGRDTPDVMKAYLAPHPRFLGLTGNEEAIAAAKSAFRVFAAAKADADDPDGYSVPHTAIAYLMGPDGEYRDHFADTLAADEVAERIRVAFKKEEVRHG